MKKLVLLGVFALGSMSFVEGNVDCFAHADAAVASMNENAIFIAPGAEDRLWEAEFYGCSEANGQLLDPGIIGN
jgi:hypothetical protein